MTTTENANTTTPQLRPRDVRSLSTSDVTTFSVAGRLALILGDTDTAVRNVLLDLGTARENVGDDLAAQRVISDLTAALADLETAARRACQEIDKATQRGAAFHERIRHRDDLAAPTAAEAEQRRAAPTRTHPARPTMTVWPVRGCAPSSTA